MSKKNIIRICVAGVIGLLIVLAATAWFAHDYGLGKGEKKVSDLRADIAEQVAAAHAAGLADYEAQVTRANQAELALLEAKEKFAIERQKLQRRIPHVTTVYKPSGEAAPVALPRSIFTVGFMQLYNAAIGLPGVPDSGIASSTGTTPETSETPDTWLHDSGLTQADILQHIADYGERCQGLESQVNELLNIHEAKEKKQP